MRNLVRHAFATIACLLFVFLWLTAGNQDALNPWIEALTQPDPCTVNPAAFAHQMPANAAIDIRTRVESSVQGPSEPVVGGWRVKRPHAGS
jgi:hypothetical protein